MLKLIISLWFVFLAVMPAMAKTTSTATCDCTSGAVEMSYVVRPGDTLSGIARSFGVSVKSIMASPHNSGIKDPDLIYPGQKVVIAPHATVTKSVPHTETATDASRVAPAAPVPAPEAVTSSVPALSPAPRVAVTKAPVPVVPARVDRSYIKFGFLVAVFVAVELLLLGVYLFLRGEKKETHDREKYDSDRTMSASEMLSMLRKVKVQDLVIALRMPITIDWHRRPIALVDLPTLIANAREREYLQGLLVEDLDKVLRNQDYDQSANAAPS